MQTLLLGCAVFSLFLLFLFRVDVARAEDMVNSPPLDVTDDDNPPTRDPGNGGGGGGGGSPPPYRQIRVRVVDYETGVAVPGISIGYSSSRTLSGRTFGVDPLNKACVKWAHYANTYIDDAWGIVKTGITRNVDYQVPGTYETQEYIDPYSLTGGYEDFQLINGTWVYAEYRETGSYTWSASLGIDFAIRYLAYGIRVSLDTIVTSTEGVINWVAYKAYNTSGRTLKFRVYTCGAPLDTKRGIGGMELHVWEIEDR